MCTTRPTWPRSRPSASEGGGAIDADTYARPDSWRAARRAAGAGLAALTELEGRRDAVAFVPVRPPGHHATADRAMGFCLLNSIAVAAASRTARGERVLIVDWDVHHGNGTQDIFWDDPDVLYVSTHQHPLYPGTGRASEVGGPAAPGSTFNLPLPPGATGDVVRPCPRSHAPGPPWRSSRPTGCWSPAGSTPTGPIRWRSWPSRAATSPTWPGWCASWRRPGRLALFLEGGYDASALASSVEATLAALLDLPGHGEAPTSGGPGMAQLEAVEAQRTRALGGPPGLSCRGPALLRDGAVDQDGAVGVGGAELADRAEQHAHELAVAAAADDEQVGALGGVDEHAGRVAVDHLGVRP